MRLGALLGPVTNSSASNMLAEQSRTYVGEGFDSLWSAQAIGRGFMSMDPIVTLSVAAAVTENVELGTAVLQVPLYHPVDLAHRIFSLMQICGDRLRFGIGAGSTETDFAAFDRSYDSRFQELSSSVDRLRTIFAEGASDGVELSPWSSVKGGPPLFLGSWGNGVERAAKYFDGWIASGHYRTPAEVISALERYRGAGGGRAIVSTLLLDSDTDLGELKDRLSKFADAGFDDAVVMFLPGGPSPAAVRALAS